LKEKVRTAKTDGSTPVHHQHDERKGNLLFIGRDQILVQNAAVANAAAVFFFDEKQKKMYKKIYKIHDESYGLFHKKRIQ